MVTVVAPPPAVVRPMPEHKADAGDNLQLEAERLHREVAAASTRNAQAAKSTIETVRKVKPFEERARDTLRALMEKMGEDYEGKR